MRNFLQEQDGWCGPAVIQALLWWVYGHKVTQSEIAAACGTTEKWGTHPERMILFLKAYGFEVTVKEHADWWDLAREKGVYKVILYQKGTGDDRDGHYSIVVDHYKHCVFLADPEEVK